MMLLIKLFLLPSLAVIATGHNCGNSKCPKGFQTEAKISDKLRCSYNTTGGGQYYYPTIRSGPRVSHGEMKECWVPDNDINYCKWRGVISYDVKHNDLYCHLGYKANLVGPDSLLRCDPYCLKGWDESIGQMKVICVKKC